VKTNLNYNSKYLKDELKRAISKQYEIVHAENQKCYEALRYTRPRTRLESLQAEMYLTDKNYANILGLGQIIKNHPELTDDDLYKFVTKHKVTLRFLNHILKVVPNTISIIRTYGEDKVVLKYIEVLEEKKKMERNR
jgi:hypothetical protein